MGRHFCFWCSFQHYSAGSLYDDTARQLAGGETTLQTEMHSNGRASRQRTANSRFAEHGQIHPGRFVRSTGQAPTAGRNRHNCIASDWVVSKIYES